MADQKVTANVVIQMMGAPKKHIEDTLKLYIDKIRTDYKEIKLLNEYRSKAKKQKDGKLYDVFAELEIESQGVEHLVWFCFDYMPASVEITSPEQLIYDSPDLTAFLNDLQSKLHKIDMMIKNLNAENQVLKKNGVTLMKNIIILQLRSGKKSASLLAKNAGVPEEHIKRFLASMEKDGKVKQEKGHYLLA